MTLPDECDLPPAIAPNILEVLVEMLGIDDPEILIELIDTFLNDASALVNALGRQWNANNQQEVMLIAHSLKSTSTTFRAERLSRLASQLEIELRVQQGQLNVPLCIDQLQQEYVRVRSALQKERQKLEDRL